MLLHFLGCGCAYRPLYGNTSAWMKNGDHLLLLDCGENIFTRLMDSELLATCSDVTVLITHCHADHAGSLSTLITYVHDELKKAVFVCYPGFEVETLMLACGIAGTECTFLRNTQGMIAGGLFYRAIRVKHADNLGCYGYVIKSLQGTLYYSGDSNSIPQEVLDAFMYGDIQELYQDSTFVTPHGTSHGSLQDLCDAIPMRLRRNVYPMHFYDDPWDLLNQMGFGLCMTRETAEEATQS